MAALAPAALPPQLGTVHQSDAGSDTEVDECWICLSSSGVLSRPCACKTRVCHRECIATWQLTNYGRREENFCRFCNQRLPKLWKPDTAKEAEREELLVAPVMAVRYNGPEGVREFKLRVRPGPEGLAMFKAHLKEILGFDVGPDFDVTFECQMPSTGSMLTLSGLNAYGAATHCAALLAATKAGAQAGPQAGATDQPAATLPAAPGTPALVGPTSPSGSSRAGQQQQQQRRVTPTVLLPSEVPVASPAQPPPPATPPHCSRRVCQTGYLPHTPIAWQQPWGASTGAARRAARRGSALSSMAAYCARGGRPAAGLFASRSLGASSSRRGAMRPPPSDATPDEVFRRELNGYDSDELYDDLLPYGSRYGALAAAPRGTTFGYVAAAPIVGAGAASRSGPAAQLGGPVVALAEDDEIARLSISSVEGRPATAPGHMWTPGAVRFGGRVLPVSPNIASPAAPAGVASASASGGAGGAAAAGIAAAAATSRSDSSSGGAAAAMALSRTLSVDDTGLTSSGGSSQGGTAVAAAIRDALPLRSGKQRLCAAEQQRGQQQRAGGDAPATAAAAAADEAGAGAGVKSAARVPSLLRRVARRTLNTLARALKSARK